MKQFDYKSVMQIPKIDKNLYQPGLVRQFLDKKLIDSAVPWDFNDTGQKQLQTYSKKDISKLKLRKGNASWS